MRDATGDLFEADSVVAHRYRVIGYRGDRGFGQVYEAEDTAMDRRVALMRLSREFSRPDARESFYETRSTAAVEDPRIVDLCDYGEDVDGRLFLVMPWVDDAETLDELLAREGALAWPRVKTIIEQIAGALEAAHQKGVLHGGLEPRRVLIDSLDGVHIVDFGLAPALTQSGRKVTLTGSLPGKIEYLSPEQVRGEAVDARSDIYALGVILWELIAGTPPFVGDSVAVADAHLAGQLPELPRRGPTATSWAPAEIEPLLHLALAKDPDERLSSATEFASLLAAMPDSVAKPMIARVPTRPLAPTPRKPAPAAARIKAAPPPRTAAPPPKVAPSKVAPSKVAPSKVARPSSKAPPTVGRSSSKASPLPSKASPLPSKASPLPSKASPPPSKVSPLPSRAPLPSSKASPPPSKPPASKAPLPSSKASPPPSQASVAAPNPSVLPSPASEVSPSAKPVELERTPGPAPSSPLPEPAKVKSTSVAQAIPPKPEPKPSPKPPPRKRRLGKLELAILVFLGFDLLLFAGWKLFANKSTPDVTVASEEPQPPSPPAVAKPVDPEPEPEPKPEPVEAEPEPAPTPQLSVEEAIAAELPPEPDTPGPVRPMSKSLSDKAFREAMVAARSTMLEQCLDTRMRRTLKVALKVAPNGEVEYARVLGSLGDTSLGHCIVKQVYKIEFPPTYEGGSHTYTLRLR